VIGESRAVIEEEGSVGMYVERGVCWKGGGEDQSDEKWDLQWLRMSLMLLDKWRGEFGEGVEGIKRELISIWDWACLKRWKKYFEGDSPCSYQLMRDLKIRYWMCLCSSSASFCFKVDIREELGLEEFCRFLILLEMLKIALLFFLEKECEMDLK